MEAIDLLLTRRSLGARFLVEPGPTPSELEKILTAGIRVPDHGKLFPWRIQVLAPDAQTQLGDFCADLFTNDNPNATPEAIEIERARPCYAPTLLVVSSHITKDHKIPEFEQLLSGGAVCQNLLNAAHALGYIGNWLTEWPTRDRRVSSYLGHPEDAETLAWIYIGSSETPPTERVRAGLDDVVTHWEGPGAALPS